MKLKIKFIIKIVVKSNVKGILNSQFLTTQLYVLEFVIDGTNQHRGHTLDSNE